MSSTSIERAASESERALMAAQLQQITARGLRWRDAAEKAFVMWCAMSLVLVLAWSAVAWGVRALFAMEMGLGSPAGLPWLTGALLLLAALALVSALRRRRPLVRRHAVLAADLQAGRVMEERHVFDAVQRFQEEGYGGLLYFLRSTDQRIFAMLDHESQDLGARGGDPLASTFRPMTRLVIVRAPRSGSVVDRQFSGAPLALDEPIELTLPPTQWPEFDGWCEFAWADLRVRMSGS